MSRITTKILCMDGDYKQVIAVRPERWSDEQWDELVGRNREHYNVELIEEDWSYGE